MSALYQAKSTQICRWHSFSNLASLENTATQTILESAHHAIQQRGAFHLVLAGGNTPRQIYKKLREADADWHRWHIYFGDERCLPAHHPERNSLMASETWLDHVAIPRLQIHAIPAELGADIGAQHYAKIMSSIKLFDLVLLGLGEDGHTASLFPGHELGHHAQSPAVLAVFDAPKAPAARVSLSANRLSATRQVLFLAAGKNKAAATQHWREGINLPAAAIQPENGVDIFLENFSESVAKESK